MGQDLATRRMREHPTVPPGAAVTDKDTGHLWPRVFCAFEGCSWAELDGAEIALHRHLLEHHAQELQSIAQHMLRNSAEDALFSVYAAAVAEKCRAQAPLAGASFDRKALKSLSDAMAGEQARAQKTKLDTKPQATSQISYSETSSFRYRLQMLIRLGVGPEVESLVCMCCGGVYPYVSEVAEKGDIQWRKPLQHDPSTDDLKFFGLSFASAQGLIGLEAYLDRYDLISQGTDTDHKLSDHENFEDWTLKLGSGSLLCCPEENGC